MQFYCLPFQKRRRIDLTIFMFKCFTVDRGPNTTTENTRSFCVDIVSFRGAGPTFIFLAISVFWCRMYSRMACLSYKYPSGLRTATKNKAQRYICSHMLRVYSMLTWLSVCWKERHTWPQDSDKAAGTDSSNQNLWLHLCPSECSVSRNQMPLRPRPR